MDNVSPLPTMSQAREPEPTRPERVETLTRICAEQLLRAFGLGNGTRTLALLARFPAERLARQVATYDEVVGESGLAAGAAWALERMARSVEVEGRENVPAHGPVLFTANHPGLADCLALFATIAR